MLKKEGDQFTNCGEWNVCPFPEPGPTAVMAAESLPFTFETVSSWELEAWYEDLQEVLSSDGIGATYISSPGNEEVSENARPRLGLVLMCGPTAQHLSSAGRRLSPWPA